MAPTSPGGGTDGGDHHTRDLLDTLCATVGALFDDLGDWCDEAVRDHVRGLHLLRDCVDAAVCEATGVFDRRQLHSGDAARSTAGWKAARLEVTRTEAKHDQTLAAAMAAMPVMAAAFRAGTIGRRKATSLAAIRTPELVEVVAAEEAFLVAQIADLGVVDADRWLRGWHQQARLFVGWTDPDEPADTTEPLITAALTRTFQDRWVLDAEMDGEHGRTLQSIIAMEVDEMFRVGTFHADDGLSAAERRGQALFAIVTRKALRKERHGAPVPSVQVIVDERTMLGIPIDGEADLRSRVCQYTDGEPLSLVTLGRYLCGAEVHRLVVDAAGEVLDAGKDIRLANRGQRRALRYRHDGRCAFPGCTAPADWTEAHHVVRWDPDPSHPEGGTDLGMLVPECRYHHHALHEGGFTMVLEADGGLTVLRPPDPVTGRREPVSPTHATLRPGRPDARRRPAA